MFGTESITDELLGSACRGCASDREKVVNALADQVRIMVRGRLVPTPAQQPVAEDLAQQALLDISAALPDLRVPTVEVLKSIASTIVSRRVIDYLRSGDHARAGEIRSLDSSVHDLSRSSPLWSILSASGLSPKSAAQQNEAIGRLMMELGSLKPLYREVIVFAFFDQLDIGQIAERFDISRSSASMLLIRAMRTLRRNLTGSSRVQHGES
jgi:RNA polymerase sigma factor (sigma-70 family)